MIAHLTFANPALIFIAEALFFLGVAAGIATYRFYRRPRTRRTRTLMLGLGGITVACLIVATALPFLAGQSIGRPSSSARLAFVAPLPGETVPGPRASVPVELTLEGGTIVPGSSLHLVPNEGHIHLYLDGALVQMTANLSATVMVPSGTHTLRAEFVALDHGPFRPPVIAEVNFHVEP